MMDDDVEAGSRQNQRDAGQMRQVGNRSSFAELCSMRFGSEPQRLFDE